MTLEQDKRQNPFVLKEIIDNIPSYIFWKDTDLNYLGVNQKFAAAAGFKSPDEIVGKSDYDCVWTKEESDFYRKMDRKVMESGKAKLNFEEPQRQKDGSSWTLLTSKVPLHNPITNEVIGILGIYTDITDRKNLELEKDNAIKRLQEVKNKMIYQEKMKSLGEMAGGIAHEINNPLTIIGGHISILKKNTEAGKLDSEKIIRTCEIIQKTVDRCSHIIKNLKHFSKDGMSDNIEDINVQELVSEVISLSEQKLKHDNIKLKLEGLDSNVRCQKIAIEQVLLNLLSNSCDAVKDIPTPEITISTAQDGAKTSIKVIDNGHGIPKKIKDKIFVPFFSTKPPGLGSGLGLPTSKSLVEKSGGELLLNDSTPNTCFEIRLNTSSLPT